MPAGQPRSGNRTFPLEPAAALAVVLAYALHLRNGFVYDDHLLVLQQSAIRSIVDLADVVSRAHYTGLPYYRPVMQMAYSLQKTLFGSSPLPYHAVNTLAAGVLFLVVSRFLALPVFRLSRPWAALTAMVFCLHPAVSSCVYPISGFETILAGIFMTTTLMFFMGKGRQNSLLAALFFLLSLLTKEQAVILPAVMLLIDFLGLAESSPGRMGRAWIRRYAPFLVLTLFYLLLRYRHFGGGAYSTWNADAFKAFFMSYAYALQVSIVPYVSLHYEPQLQDWFSPWRLLTAAVAAAILLFAGGSRKVPGRRNHLFFAGLFVVAVLPTSNIIKQETPFSERYVFTALLALAGLASGLLAASPALRTRSFFRICAVLLLVTCAGITMRRGIYFRNDEVFSQQWMKTSPGHPSPRLLYGNVLIRGGDFEGAEEHFREAVKINPGHAQTRNSLGVVYVALGRRGEAEREFREAVRIYPRYAEAHFNLGLGFAGGGDLEGAAREMEEVLAISPAHADARYRLGLIRARRGRVGEAVELWKEVLEINPGHAGAREELNRYGEGWR